MSACHTSSSTSSSCSVRAPSQASSGSAYLQSASRGHQGQMEHSSEAIIYKGGLEGPAVRCLLPIQKSPCRNLSKIPAIMQQHVLVYASIPAALGMYWGMCLDKFRCSSLKQNKLGKAAYAPFMKPSRRAISDILHDWFYNFPKIPQTLRLCVSVIAALIDENSVNRNSVQSVWRRAHRGASRPIRTLPNL